MKRKPATKTGDDRETIERLLDAAELLFGLHGYDGVGMRMLADTAKVNLGAATYHFGSKENLYVETFMRQFRPIHAERIRLLRAAEAAMAGKPVPVGKIVECMLRPHFDAGQKQKGYQMFLARNLFMAPDFLRPLIHKELAPGMEAFTAALKRALPAVPEDLIHVRSMLAMGGMLMFAIRAKEIPRMQEAPLHEAVFSEMVGYVTAGMISRPVLSPDERPPLPVPLKTNT